MPAPTRLSFVEHVCKRPKVYTTNGSLFEIYAVFTGFAQGLPDAIAHPEHGDTEYSDQAIVAETQRWISSHRSGNALGIQEFLKLHSTEELAIDAIGEFAAKLRNKAGHVEN